MEEREEQEESEDPDVARLEKKLMSYDLIRPDAVIRGTDGYLRVDYSRLGLHLMTWQEWTASRPFKTAENGTATAPKAMSDSDMDKVTAGLLLSTNGMGISGKGGINLNAKVNSHAVDNGHGLQSYKNFHAACISSQTC